MAKPKFLYIVSSPHGGSTLLSLVLGKHERATNLGEASFIPKLLALGELCTCGARLSECTEWAKVFSHLATASGVDMRHQPYGLYLGEALKGRDGSGLIDKRQQTPLRYLLGKFRGGMDTAALYWTPESVGMDVTSLPSVKASNRNTLALYEAAAAALDVQLVVDASKMPRKAPNLYLENPEQVRILHLARDGRGVSASRKKYMPVSRAAERWDHYHRLSKRILEKWVPQEHRMWLRYEDFVGSPEETLQDIYSWLEMPYSPACLAFGDDMIEHSAGGNPARFGMSGGIRPADERWRTLLTDEDLNTFSKYGGDLNREFGYG